MKMVPDLLTDGRTSAFLGLLPPPRNSLDNEKFYWRYIFIIFSHELPTFLVS